MRIDGVVSPTELGTYFLFCLREALYARKHSLFGNVVFLGATIQGVTKVVSSLISTVGDDFLLDDH